ncbi:MAG: hypothetical protein ACXVA9_09435 [Bdellovibrionales bacterium]
MKHKLLATLMFTAALSTIACDKSSSDKASDCLSDAACKAQVAAASGAAGPQLYPLGPQAAGQVPPGLINQPFRVSSVANAAIKAQSAKVQAQIADYDNNPLSTYYKAPTPDVPKATVEPPGLNKGAPASIEPVAQEGSLSDTSGATR